MKYLLICNNCNHKVYTEGRDIKLAEIPTADIPTKGGVSMPQKRKFRCPTCGHTFKIVEIEGSNS